MVLRIQSEMAASLLLYLFLVVIAIGVADSVLEENPKEHLLISCGMQGDVGGGWRGDEGSTFISSTTSTATATTGYTLQHAYESARIFWSPLSYSFPLSSPSPVLVRLYFYTGTRYRNNNSNIIDPSQFSISANANSFELFHGFNPFCNNNSNPQMADPDQRVMREFYISLGEITDNPAVLNLTITTMSYGFVNGIEVVSIPDQLYFDRVGEDNNLMYFDGSHPSGIPGGPSGIPYNIPDSMAMETVIRLNVGGPDVQPSADSGFYRTWYNDDQYLGPFTGYMNYYKESNGDALRYTTTTPAYIAPETVYKTWRMMGDYPLKWKLQSNLTWLFDVDAGFDYLVRLHFCEFAREVNQSGQEQFNISVNNQIAATQFDVFDLTGGRGRPMYQDFVTRVDYNIAGAAQNFTGGKIQLSVALYPVANTLTVDAFLNGLEIMKLNNSSGSLAAAESNLPCSVTNPSITSSHAKSSPHLVSIIIGGTLGVILLSIVALALFFICRGKDKEEASSLILSSTKPTTPKWAPIAMDESHSSTATSTATISNSSVASSLPSDLCRRFSLNQVRIATSDFDDSVVIGSGGFGKVYKGSIDNGATLVAIKRLNPSSNQGANEFRNEIEMLSRLRHIHLVSLIGYCEDHGEMILVYEYMPRGTLRDHLLYKNDPKNNENSPLSWKQRLMICAGSARGLHYLHSGANHPIIHRDVKSTNILLDEKWTAKVSDFGLSKVGPTTGAGHVSTAVKGSVGYLDPEYYRLRQLTEKSDVYSFGVVLFEVLCGRQAMNPQLLKEQVNLALWARSHYIAGSLETIVDPNLAGQIAPESLRKFGEVAEMCVRDHGSERPSMSDIVWALEFALQLQQTADQKITRTPNGDDHGVATKTDQVLISSEDNLSESSLSIGGSGTVKSFDTRKVASSSDSEAVGLTISASVFSEIMHPEAR